MGIFKGGTFQDNKGTSYNYVEVWGRVITAPKVSYANVQRVGFTVKMHQKPNAYMNCVKWGDDLMGAIAAGLEADEEVVVWGTWNEREFTNKKGEHKKYSDLNVFCVLPLSLLGFTHRLYSSKKIHELLGANDADPMESAGDYEEAVEEYDYELNM